MDQTAHSLWIALAMYCGLGEEGDPFIWLLWLYSYQNVLEILKKSHRKKNLAANQGTLCKQKKFIEESGAETIIQLICVHPHLS